LYAIPPTLNEIFRFLPEKLKHMALFFIYALAGSDRLWRIVNLRLAHFVLFAFLAIQPLPALWKAVGPDGGPADVIRVSFSSPDHIAAATRNGQIFFSKDAGENWSRCAFPTPLGTVVHSLAIDPTDSQLWYLGVEEEFGHSSGIYRTKDGCATWELLPGLRGKAVWSIAVWRKDPNLVLAGTGEGIYRSTDRGEGWSRITPESNMDLRPVVSLAFHPTDAKIILAGTTHLPYRTSDGGATWQSVHTGMLDDSDVFSVAVHPTNPSIVYASACSGAYRSVTGGTRWARLPTQRGAFRVYVVAVHPATPNVIFAGSSAGLFRSEDEGRIWNRISPHGVRSIDFDPTKASHVYFASTGGLLKSVDGGKTVSVANRGFSNGNWRSLTVTGSTLQLTDITDKMLVSGDAGDTWKAAGPSAPPRIRLPKTTRIRKVRSWDSTVAVASSSGIFVSFDDSQTWRACGAAQDDVDWNDVAVLDAETILAATSHGLLRATGECKTWSPVREGLDRNTIFTLLKVPGRAELFLAQGRSLMRSTDAGVNWQAVEPLPHGGSPIDLAFLSTHPDRIYALFPRGGVAYWQGSRE
jgi:photosystem II stability/assembly factor-like uncharacterized protein